MLSSESYKFSQELIIIDKQLGYLENDLTEKAIAMELKIFRRTVDKISPIVNLVFSLEIRLSEKATLNHDPILTSVLRRRLNEGRDIKDRHENSLLTVGRIVRVRLGISRHISYSSIIRNKQRVIALSRILKMEMKYAETQMKVILDIL